VSRLVVALDRGLVRGLVILLAAGLLVVGSIVFLRDRSSHDADAGQQERIAQPDRELASYGNRIALPRAAVETSRAFVRAAVLRTDLARGWELAAPALRVGFTRREWLTGAIPVVPFPAREFARASFKVVRSRQRDVLLGVYIVSKNPAAVSNLDFLIELVPVQNRWLVSYWAPRGHIGTLPAIP
jgi:hypothetical protein